MQVPVRFCLCFRRKRVFNLCSGTAAASTGSGAATAATSVGALSTTDITTNATADSTDAQSSLLLDSRVIATGFLQNGQNVQEAGQVASLTSNNNFINYCLTQSAPITNGLQLLGGSCNPAPIGTIPAVTEMPSAKFSNPANGDTIAANTDFTITMNVNNLITGNFVNADESYFAAPQQVDASSGQIIGHTHVVMELLSDLGQTTPTNPQVFAFFKGVDTAAVGGAVTVDVTAGVPDGAYRLCSINSSSNHQPVIVPVAQHGALDDCVYVRSCSKLAILETDKCFYSSLPLETPLLTLLLNKQLVCFRSSHLLPSLTYCYLS
ncbi:hypothetical protein BT96DRAFT_807092 [Gymnopus androsaceus JB14]|uniref:Uncharacterized protein n=1 Tax=Gymnopus androsaceus JB14 TaxID=1447944 RepID=A0A6A4IJH2_9AGAR|nr:hypothetical protein BT96DRAFT_807092 [Gymnopus androsaceus JB14]